MDECANAGDIKRNVFTGVVRKRDIVVLNTVYVLFSLEARPAHLERLDLPVVRPGGRPGGGGGGVQGEAVEGGGGLHLQPGDKHRQQRTCGGTE